MLSIFIYKYNKYLHINVDIIVYNYIATYATYLWKLKKKKRNIKKKITYISILLIQHFGSPQVPILRNVER